MVSKSLFCRKQAEKTRIWEQDSCICRPNNGPEAQKYSSQALQLTKVTRVAVDLPGAV